MKHDSWEEALYAEIVSRGLHPTSELARIAMGATGRSIDRYQLDLFLEDVCAGRVPKSNPTSMDPEADAAS